MDELAARVLAVVRRIPSGRVLTYGDVAALAEGDATARDVGQVLLRHGEREDVPWWRVLRADGTPPPHLLDRQLALLHDAFVPHQVPDDLRRAIVEVETRVESVFNNFRGTVDGRQVD
ncbi:MAG TPA: MGMT family protein, partial [Actinomycetota bacterium]|nr:MGMT family protein [Actinomycetota bacterium]